MTKNEIYLLHRPLNHTLLQKTRFFFCKRLISSAYIFIAKHCIFGVKLVNTLIDFKNSFVNFMLH